MYDISRSQIPILPASRIMTLRAAAPVAATGASPKILASFEQIFQAALDQASRDYEMNRLFNSEFYE